LLPSLEAALKYGIDFAIMLFHASNRLLTYGKTFMGANNKRTRAQDLLLAEIERELGLGRFIRYGDMFDFVAGLKQVEQKLATLVSGGNAERAVGLYKEMYRARGDIALYAALCERIGLSPKDCEHLAEMEKAKRRWKRALAWIERGLELEIRFHAGL
jgi:hypothetical protein